MPPFLTAVAMITLCCLFVKKEPLTVEGETRKLPLWRTLIYSALFVFSIVIVFRVVPFQLGLIIVPLALLILDRKALRDVDYGLLFTFVAFFVFSGNMARIPAVQNVFGGLMKSNPLLVAVLSCQVISNVPSAILLSQFTTAYAPLLIGVNIGGTGTLISSLASLITFREYTSKNPKGAGKYLALFSAFNFGFLIVLTALSLLFWV